MSQDRLSNLDADLRRYEALLEMADLMVHHGSLPELFAELGERLRGVVSFDYANFSLHDPHAKIMRLHIWADAKMETGIPAEMPVASAPGGWFWENQQPLILPELNVESRFPAVLNLLRERGLRSYCLAPLT